MNGPCVFCEHIAAGEVTVSNNLAAAFPDGFPISPGHTLVVPQRHEADYFALTRYEQIAILDLINEMRDRLTAEHSPDGFNVGLNSGEAAGQTVDHAHLHLIPRSHGDTPGPPDGVRWILPEKAREPGG